MGKTAIQWCTHTLNFLRGCDPVSPGCANCWAAVMAARYSGPGRAFEGLAVFKDRPGKTKLAIWTDKPVLRVPEAMLEAMSGGAHRLVFVNSVSDTFHEDVDFAYIAAWWGFMAASKHTFQVVTKRAARMREFFEWTALNGGTARWTLEALDLCRRMIDADHKASRLDRAHRWAKARDRLLAQLAAPPPPPALPNVWLLVSTENQRYYDERVAQLLQCPAVVRGVSAEPLLGPINLGLGQWVRLDRRVAPALDPVPWVAEPGVYRAQLVPETARVVHSRPQAPPDAHPSFRPKLAIPVGPQRHVLGIHPDEYELLPDIDWAIPGGESGPDPRPNELWWTRDILDQIKAARMRGSEVEPFLKQLGARPLDGQPGATFQISLEDDHGGDEGEWSADLQGHRHMPRPLPHRRTFVLGASPPAPGPGQLGLAIG